MGIYQGETLLTARPNSVLYTTQILTEEERAQARENIDAIDAKYVEDSIETFAANLDEGLPNSSAQDNGKFLRVINGVPTWATVINAEEVRY